MNRDELRRQIMTLLDEAEIIIKAPPEFYAMKDKITLVIDGKAGIADDILALIAPELEKAEKYDALCLINDPVQVERGLFLEMVEKAEKWDKLMILFDTSCDKCFLNNICGTRDNPEAVCEDIKDALNQPEEEGK